MGHYPNFNSRVFPVMKIDRNGITGNFHVRFLAGAGAVATSLAYRHKLLSFVFVAEECFAKSAILRGRAVKIRGACRLILRAPWTLVS
jgi:hypothetical protein